ncbi:MAG: thioesterase family protein [Acidimicrobiia bacterium]|nr:thioesterase family protein [Acidimicrobiia bacterium]
MNDSLAPGLRGSARYTVTDDMSPPHLPLKVLSTPDMIRLIEQTCLVGVQEYLDDGQTTVGIHVCVSHAASVASGREVEVTYELTERDRRKLTFETQVTSGDDVVSEGTHQRFVVS